MSINEIAKHLKVSKSTVSLVINGKAVQGRISKALAQRILDYVEEIGYKPNPIAQSLATGRSNTVGLIVENISDSFFGPIALYIEEYLRPYGYQVFYSSTLGDDLLAKDILQTMVDKKVEGLILCPTYGMDKMIQELQKQGTPLVLFDRKSEDLAVNFVGTDNFNASATAVQHLLEKGYRNIGFVTIDSTQSQMQDRLAAYNQTILQADRQPLVLQIPAADAKPLKVKAISEFVAQHPDLDALYFSTNYLCIAGLKALQQLQQANKLALICFDNHELFDMLQPTISCIEQPLEQIARQIVKLFIQQMSTKKGAPQQEIIPSKLIIRQSTC